MSGTVYGYARVSTVDQNLDRQLDALYKFGIDRIFADKASGKNFERPEWMRLTSHIAEGDVLVVKSIDRLGRNYDETINQWRHITKERGVDVVVLDMPLLDTRHRTNGVTGALISDIVLQLLSYVAQVERESIHQRQAEGIAVAKARGVKFGRPRKRRPPSYLITKSNYLNGNITRAMAASQMGGIGKHLGSMAPRRCGRAAVRARMHDRFPSVNGLKNALKRYTFLEMRIYAVERVIFRMNHAKPLT